MREPSEIALQRFYEKFGYVKLRVLFQVKGIGRGGYQGARGKAVVIKLPHPRALWLAIIHISRFIKELDYDRRTTL